MTKRRDLKFTWLSNSPNVNSGYSCFTRDFLFRALKDGWQCAAISNFGVEGYHTFMYGDDLIDERFKGLRLKVYPKISQPYGSDAILPHSQDFGAQVAFVMLDLFSLDTAHLEQLTNSGTKFIPYLPIDQEPINKQILQNLRYAYKIITFSKFGQEALEKEGYASKLILEGTDTESMKPKDKIKMREKYKFPQDAFLFGMIAANKENPPRKAFQEVLEGFAKFYKNHPEAAIFFHTQQMAPGGFPILEYANYLKVNHRCFFLPPYFSAFKANHVDVCEQMACVDVYLQPSTTEGFGLTSVEAMACGKSVIVNNCHSMPEVVIPGKTGEICEFDKTWWRGLGGYVFFPNPDSIHNKMELLFNRLKDPKQAKQIAKDCRNHVLEKYNIDKLFENEWTPFLESLQDEVLGESGNMEEVK